MSESSSSSLASLGSALSILAINFLSSLTLILITLKLIGQITWSWWWVLSAFWITPTAIFTLFIVILRHMYIKDRKAREQAKKAYANSPLNQHQRDYKL